MEAAGVLSTAFGLGLLLHASQAAFFTAISGHIKTLFLHRRRLVLLSFLLCVSIYSVFQFATLLLLEDASCSVTVRFTIFFDQGARVSALALIVWKICDETNNNTVEKVFWVVIVGLRVLLGGIIVGFTGWAFMPVCFPQPMHLAAGVVQVIFDGVCWGVLLFRIVAIWTLFRDQGRGGKTDGKSQGYGLFLIVLSFIGWTIGSFPYLMNVGESIFVRMIPYILTLVLSIGVLGCFPSIVFSIPIPRSDDPYNRRINRFGSLVSSPTRRARSVSSRSFNPGDIESNKVNRFPTYGMGLDKNYNGARTSTMFRSIIGAPIVHPGTALPWSVDTDAIENITKPKPAKAMPENRRSSIAPSHNAGPSISGPMGPVLRNAFDTAEGNAETPLSNPFGRVKTTDLKTAAEMERQRIDAAFEREQERKKFQEAASGISTPIISATTPKPAIDYRSSVKRKPVISQLPSGTAAFRVSAVKREGSELDSPSSLRQSVFAAAERASGWGMRYSTNSIETEDDDTTRYTSVSHAPYNLAAPPRIPQLEAMGDDPKVMFVNEIVYDDPALVNSIMGKTDVALTTSRYSQSTAGTVRRSPSLATKRLPDIPTPARELDESVTSSPSASVMDRPRAVKKLVESRTFPSNKDYGLAVKMKYNNKQLTAGRSSNPVWVETKPLPEIPTPKVITGKKPPREMVFPIPPARAPPVRKPAPSPITITIPAAPSPEIVQNVLFPEPVKIPESIPSARPDIPKKSGRRLMSLDANYQEVNFSAYETAKAWVDSVSAISDKPGYAESIVEPLPSIAYNSANDISARSSTVMSECTHSTLQRRSLIALTTSPSVKEGGEFTDIEAGSGSESGEDEDPEAASSGSGSDRLTQSEADEMIMCGGEGYSTEEESYEEYFSDSEEGYPDDGVIISDIEDGSTYDKIALAERKLNAKLQGLTETLPHVIPHQFQIGDRIPTFSESRRKYGSRRKPPPSPIGFLMQQRRTSQQQIQARLTMFGGTQYLTPLEDLMNRLPVNKKRDRVSYMSDGRNSLIARLEMEMGQQESQWVGMQKTMARSSNGSVEETPEQRLARPSQNLAQRRSLLAKVNSGIDRRLSAANSRSSSSPVQPSMWQMQLADAQIEYLVQTPLTLKNPSETLAKPVAILESQNTPVSAISESDLEVYEDSEDESPFGTNHGEGLKDWKEEQEEEIYGYDGGIQLPQATVYCLSTTSTSIHSHTQSPLQIYCSSITESFSPSVNSSSISLLWNARPTREQSTHPRNQLWAYCPHPPKSPLASPPAADLRPKHHITLAPVNKATTSLWTKACSPQPTPRTSLWRNPKEFRQECIIASSFVPGRSRHSLKRVTFVEVVTVEPSGFFGKRRKLWGARKKKSQPVDITAVPATAKHLQVMVVPINRILDDVTIKYATKMLPPLPPQEAFVLPEEPKNVTHSSLWSHSSPISVIGPKTLLWNPAPEQEAPDIQLFANNTSSLCKKVIRQVVPPTLTSSTLWGACQQSAIASLWSNTNTGYLWPSASPLPVQKYSFLSVRHARAPLDSPVLESTELWKPPLVKATKETTLGLWSDGRTVLQEPAPHANNYLWLTAPSLSFPYTPAPPRSRQANAPLATLMSNSLWRSSSAEIAKTTLWTLPARKSKSMLWPEGKRERVEVGSLWPSAPPAKTRVETVKPRSQAITPHTRVESTSLWVAIPACEDERAGSAGLWEPVSTVVKVASAEPTPPVAAAVPQIVGPKLWLKSQDTKIIATGYLWPSASELPVPASHMPAIRARFTPSTLPSLESRQLWSPAMEKTGLWPPREKLTGLWPHGGIEKVISSASLWPSAAPLATTIEETTPLIRSRSVSTEPSRLESEKLWAPVDTHLATPEPGQMWKPVTAHPTTIPVITEQIEETPPVLLWAAPKRVPHAIIPNYLWPSAPVLPPSRAAPATRPRTPTIKSIASLLSKSLWSSAPVSTPHLWSAPVLESGLWPHGKLRNTTTGTLWPSANPLPSQVGESVYVVRFMATTLQLESSQLWGTKTAPKAQLWTAPAKSTGLWPRGEATESVFGTLWPSAAGLKDIMTVSIHSRKRCPVTLANLESHELWNNSSVKPSLWLHSIKQSGLWPQGTFTIRKKQLWSADDIARRPNPTLRMTLGEKRRKYVRRVTLATLTSAVLWRRPEETKPKFILPGKIESADKLAMSPINVPELQTKENVASLPPGLWANPSPVPPPANLPPIAALWTASPLGAPRAKITICREVIVPRKKPGRTSNSRLSPVQGKLWTSSHLPEEPPHQVIHARTWVKKQVGMWNADCSTVTLAQLPEKKCLLWDRQSKDRRAVFAHLSLNTCSPKQKRNTAGRSLAVLESDHLWASERDVAHHSSGLWHPITKPAKQIEDRLSPRESTPVTPRTRILWEKCDKPLQLASVIPVIPSRSNKRAASNIPPPLFLAVGGPMWMSNKPSEPRPREPCQMGILATATEKNSKLWVISAVKRKSIFENLSIESIRRSTTARKSITITAPMEGSLWEKSRPTLSPARPKLWRKEEKSQGLWTADGNVNNSGSTMTLIEAAVPAVATMHLWGGDNAVTTPIFADLSLESFRSRREFTAKTFSTPPEGLWRKKGASEPLVIEHPSIGLWGSAKPTTPITGGDIPMKAVLTLWQKYNPGTSMFADLPVESSRSKKSHCTVTLPVFSEGLWKKKIALPERPQLWKPTPKITGLWDASAKTKTLAQISLERKAKGTKQPLWSKHSASRTTTKVPQRSPLTNVRISDDLTLLKVTGGLWKPKTAARQPPQLWTVPKHSAEPVKPSGSLLWAQGHGSKTTTAVPERTKVAFIPSNTPLPKVSGSLWKPKSAAKPTGLWKRPIKTVATATVSPSAPLWTARTASRTTTAIPQRLPSAPKKKDSRSIILPPVTGSLWQPPRCSPVKGLWKAPAPPPRRTRRASLLWAAHSASRTTTATPVRTKVPKRLTEAPLQTVSGTLWKRPSTEPKPGLWKRTIPTVATFRKTSTSTLWSPESASRTTSAKPERAPFVPKPVSEKSLILPPATGELWAPSSAAPQTITLWSQPTTPSNGTGVWDAHDRTPSLAEIKLALASRQDKTELWQRRSVLASKAAIIDISKVPSSVPQKKVKVLNSNPALPVADGSLWRSCVDGKDEQGIMWITRSSRSSRSSSFESEYISPGVSRASTISDMSDESDSPPTTGEGDGFKPEVVRVHSTKVSVSSSVGESLWRPNEPGEEKGKEKGLWSGDEVIENGRSMLVTERPVRIALPGQREQELPMWDGSHSLWSKPSTNEKTLWPNPSSYACSSVSDEDFASAVSELSDESHYEDFEPSSYELDHSSGNSSSSHVFVGQFRCDNYLLHQQPNTQLLENSPSTPSLRTKILRKNLRPTTNEPGDERKRRNSEGEEEMEG